MKARRCSATFSSRGLGYPQPIQSDYGASVSAGLVSVVPTFRPPQQLLDLVATLREQGPVIVSDDGSPCTFDPLLANIASIEGVTVLRHHENAGIGRGLNDGLEFAQVENATWLLTVDQDSSISKTYADELLRAGDQLLESGYPIGVIGAETVSDESGSMTYPVRSFQGVLITEEVIQSGSLWSVAALISIRGFDTRLGNDAVDAAACLGLRESNYLVTVAPGLSFHHRLGSASQHRLFGRQVMVTHHPKSRQNAMLRNRLRLLPREMRQSPRHAFRTVRRVVVNRSMGWVHKR